MMNDAQWLAYRIKEFNEDMGRYLRAFTDKSVSLKKDLNQISEHIANHTEQIAKYSKLLEANMLLNSGLLTELQKTKLVKMMCSNLLDELNKTDSAETSNEKATFGYQPIEFQANVKPFEKGK